MAEQRSTNGAGPIRCVATTEPISASEGLAGGSDIVIPLLAEEAVIAKRQVHTGVVRVAVTTASHQRQIEEMLTQERVVVERVPVGRVVESVPPVREEGDTTILSVVEEALVLERRLVLKEEVRITRVRTTQAHRETVQLREQFATVSRSNAVPVPATTQKTTLKDTAS